MHSLLSLRRSLVPAITLVTLTFGAPQALRPQAPAPQSSQAGAAAAPAESPQRPKAKPSSADDNPFPEAQSQAAQKQAAAEDQSDRVAASSGSVAGASGGAVEPSSSSRDKLAGIDILGDHDARTANGAGGTVVDAKLSTEDVKVGQQYFAIGNYQGAYERFKEAVAVNPANADAVFYLAEAARKTTHLDESAENYRLFLAAAPDGGKAKAARKALAQLEGK